MKTEFSTLRSVLRTALSLKRPHGGYGEATLAAYMSAKFKATMIDAHGNLHFDRRVNKERSLFTAHLDAVHHKDGKNEYDVVQTPSGEEFWHAKGDVLGADDGAGVAILGHMMANKVPGYYVLFRGEECGGIGSRGLVDDMPDLLTEFDRAIAFDRQDYEDIITHQAGGMCASDEFADALGWLLGEQGVPMVGCDMGVYTDTAEFTDLIPECTNLSVGYKHQHSKNEQLNVTFLEKLARATVTLDWETLPVSRAPGDDGFASRYSNFWMTGTSKKSPIDDDALWDAKVWDSIKTKPDERFESYAKTTLESKIEAALKGDYYPIEQYVSEWDTPREGYNVKPMLIAECHLRDVKAAIAAGVSRIICIDALFLRSHWPNSPDGFDKNLQRELEEAVSLMREKVPLTGGWTFGDAKFQPVEIKSEPAVKAKPVRKTKAVTKPAAKTVKGKGLH